MKRADLTYDELAERLKKHGFKETKDISNNNCYDLVVGRGLTT
ncbi:hypothetical protein [Bradyrhizobium sp.]